MSEIRVLYSLHRPYHCPLWIVKWICCFYVKRSRTINGYFLYEDLMTDIYFKMLEWLMKYYPVGRIGIPSKDAIESVWNYFEQRSLESRAVLLKDILAMTRRPKGIETKVYSTYKAVSYYNNLAKDKLHFIDSNEECNCWNYNTFRNFRFSCYISNSDRKIYIQQILKYDGHFFLSQILLQKYSKKYDLNIEDVVYEFMQKYYPISRFYFVSRSHQNYYVVRKHWIEQLNAITSSGALGTLLNKCIDEDSQFSLLKSNVLNNISIYADVIKKRSTYLKLVALFYKSYKNNLKEQEDKSGFVNLYDICSDMKMNYVKFNAFIAEFYETERMKKNLFFINIVSTIDQRKRFYVRETPVLKIKIS